VQWTQASLFGREPPSCDAAFPGMRRQLLAAGAWIDVLPGWLAGHEQLLQTFAETLRFRSERRQMYERVVDVPRLHAVLPDDGPAPAVLQTIQAALAERYGEPFPRVSVAYYRDGRDSVAWHGDYVARRMQEATVATISLGAPRRFLLRPCGGGPSLALSLGFGDLLVMGGTCQRTWQHSVPKLARAAPRMALMFRPVWYEPAANQSQSGA
jgi:alkylated DNA repair dioxygenase AlkB